MMTLLGVDGCKAGWVAASSDEAFATVTFDVTPRVSSIVGTVRHDDAFAAIDIPIGLPDCGARACDVEARRVLGPRQGSRVFPAPSRSALGGATYEQCCTLNRIVSGVALSKQAHAILPKIREVDEAMSPQLQDRFREVHPEVAFCVLNRVPLQHRKKTLDGQRERMAILERFGIRFDPDQERRRLGASRVQIDDLIDAAVSLITASRIADGNLRVLGGEQVDARGLRMEICA